MILLVFLKGNWLRNMVLSCQESFRHGLTGVLSPARNMVNVEILVLAISNLCQAH